MKEIINPKYIKIIRYLIFALCIIAYCVWSFLILKDRIPFIDETHAWNISANCSFSELLEVSKHEGHPILWYLLIKPFAVNNLFFPYSMLVINWIFAFSAVLILWFKSPFSTFIKAIITFSVPIKMFSVYARCYSIGIFILFLLCTLYKNRRKNPLLYSFLIILLANTSVMGIVMAFPLGLLFCWDIFVEYKNKTMNLKNISIIFLIFISGAFLILLQLFNFSVPSYSTIDVLRHSFFEFYSAANYFPKDYSLLFLLFMLIFGAFFSEKISNLTSF